MSLAKRLGPVLACGKTLRFTDHVSIDLVDVKVPEKMRTLYERAETGVHIETDEKVVYKHITPGTDPRVRREAIFVRLLSPLVMLRSTPHVLLPVGIHVGEHRSTFIMELGGRTLHSVAQDKFMTENKLATLLFQVVFSLCIIRDSVPGFVHGDLHTGNVLVNQNVTPYVAKYSGFDPITVTQEAMLCDFYYGQINAVQHESFDIVFLLDALLKLLFKRKKLARRYARVFRLCRKFVPVSCRYRSNRIQEHDRDRLRQLKAPDAPLSALNDILWGFFGLLEPAAPETGLIRYSGLSLHKLHQRRVAEILSDDPLHGAEELDEDDDITAIVALDNP